MWSPRWVGSDPTLLALPPWRLTPQVPYVVGCPAAGVAVLRLRRRGVLGGGAPLGGGWRVRSSGGGVFGLLRFTSENPAPSGPPPPVGWAPPPGGGERRGGGVGCCLYPCFRRRGEQESGWCLYLFSYRGGVPSTCGRGRCRRGGCFGRKAKQSETPTPEAPNPAPTTQRGTPPQQPFRRRRKPHHGGEADDVRDLRHQPPRRGSRQRTGPYLRRQLRRKRRRQIAASVSRRTACASTAPRWFWRTRCHRWAGSTSGIRTVMRASGRRSVRSWT